MVCINEFWFVVVNICDNVIQVRWVESVLLIWWNMELFRVDFSIVLVLRFFFVYAVISAAVAGVIGFMVVLFMIFYRFLICSRVFIRWV